MTEITLPALATLILVAVISGWLAGLVTRGSGFGLAGNIIAAFLGAFVGVYLLGLVGLDLGDGLVWLAAAALVSAFLILAIIGEMRR